MGKVIAELLPLAVGVAVSFMTIVAAILMLLAPRARGASVGLLLGWVAGIVLATTVVAIIAGTAGAGTTEEPSAGASWARLALGALLLVLAVRDWRRRPAPGQPAHMPAWIAAVDKFTPLRAAGLGVLLSAVNPKNLALCAGAGVAVASSSLVLWEQVVCVAVFTVIASSTVAAPVVAYLVASARMRAPLDRLKVWLVEHNNAVMAVVLLIFGAVLIGKGIGGLT